MNKLTLENKKDFPFTTNVLKFMQTAYSMLEKLSALGADNYIVTGCEETGSALSDGYMVLNGVLMPFKGGSIQANVRIIKTVQNVQVDLGTREETLYSAEFGTSTEPTENVPWSSIIRIKNLSNLMDRLDSAEPIIDGHSDRLDDLEFETSWYEAPLLEGSDDLSSQLLAMKRKGNVIHYRIQFRFNKENPTTYPAWQLPDWAIAADQMYTSGRQHGCVCLYEKQGSVNINSLPASFYSEDSVSYPKQAKVGRGYAEGTLFGHSFTGNNFDHEGTFIV